MTSEEKMEEIHDILRDVWGRYISADEGLECIEAALHSVEAEKEESASEFMARVRYEFEGELTLDRLEDFQDQWHPAPPEHKPE